MANEKEGRISGLFSKVRSSNRWFRKNSDLYQSIVDATNEYTEQMNKTVTEKSVDELSKIEAKLKAATESYLSTRKHPKTIEGRARYNYVKQVSNLLGATDELRDYKQLKNYKTNLLVEAVDELRNGKVVDITEKEKTVYGAGASKRIRFEYEGKDGFFTPDEKQGKSMEDVQQNKLEKLNEMFKKQNKETWEKMTKQEVTCKNWSGYMSTGINGNKTDLESIAALRVTCGAEKIAQFTEKELKEFIEYHRELNKIETSTFVMADAGIADYERVGKRNTATSRVASMLGMEDKVAKSTNIKVIDKDVEMEGSFMETAKGIDSRSKEGENKLLSKGEIDLTAGSLQRDLNRMQVLDMVCGQIDRHGGNFFYQVSERPVNGKYQITGIQGIDNDMSFGNINLGGENKQLPPISQLTLIDEEMLTSLNEFTPDKIKFALGEMLNEDEINAVISRRQEILIKARSGQLRVVKANEWGTNTLEAMEGDKYYAEVKKEITNLPELVKRANDNIVVEYEAAVERVEEYNKAHPGKEQSMPEKPEHYEEYKKDKGARQYELELKNAKAYNAAHRDSPIELPKAPEYYSEYRENQVRQYETKLREVQEYNLTHRNDPRPLPKTPEYYSEYKENHIDELTARLEKKGTKGIRPPLPPRNSKAQINEAANRVASDNGLGIEKAAQEPTENEKQSMDHVDELAARLEKKGTKGIRPPLPPRNSKAQINEVANRVASDNGLGIEKATQEPTRQQVSLDADLAPKASISKIEPKQPVKQAQKQNNGFGMNGK